MNDRIKKLKTLLSRDENLSEVIGYILLEKIFDIHPKNRYSSHFYDEKENLYRCDFHSYPKPYSFNYDIDTMEEFIKELDRSVVDEKQLMDFDRDLSNLSNITTFVEMLDRDDLIKNAEEGPDSGNYVDVTFYEEFAAITLTNNKINDTFITGDGIQISLIKKLDYNEIFELI